MWQFLQNSSVPVSYTHLLFLEKLAIGAVAIVMVGWIGYSAYGVLTREDPDEEKTVVTTEMDTTAITDYLSQLSGDAEETK